MSNYLRDVLGAEKNLKLPAQPQGLVADAGPDIPGGEGANEGFWRRQIRDAKGRWAKMFGSVTFSMDFPNIGKVSGHGKFVRISKPGVAVIKVKNNPNLPDGEYEIPSANFTNAKGIIPDDDFERITGKSLDSGTVKARIPDADFERVTGNEPVAQIYPIPDISKNPSLAWWVDEDGMVISEDKLDPSRRIPENLRIRDIENNRILDGNGREVKFKFENRESADPRVQEVRHERGFIDKNEITEADVIRDVKDAQELYELMYDGEVCQAAPEIAWNAFRIAAADSKYIKKDKNAIGKSALAQEVLDTLDKLPTKQKAKILRAVKPSDLNEEKARALIDLVNGKNGEALTKDEMRQVHRKFRNLGVDLTNLQMGNSTNYTQNNLGAPRGLMPQLGDDNDAKLFRKYCADNGIKITDGLMTPDQLTPIQSEMDMGKVGGIAQGFLNPESREKLRKLPIYVTRDGYVIDGHHRWAAALIAQDELGEDIELNVVVVDMDHGEGIRLANEFTDFAGVKKADLSQKFEEKEVPDREVAGEVGIKGNPSESPPIKPPPEPRKKEPIYEIPDVEGETDTDGKPLEWYVDSSGNIIPADKLTHVDKTKANRRIRDIQNNRVLDGYGRKVEFKPEFKDESSPTAPTRHEGGFWDLNEIDPSEVRTDITDPQEAYEVLYDGGFIEVDKDTWVEALKIAAADRKYIGADENAIGGAAELARELDDELKKLEPRQYNRLRRAISSGLLNEERANSLLSFLRSKNGSPLSSEEMQSLTRKYRTNGVDVTNMKMYGKENYTNNNLGAERGLMPQLGTDADQKQFEKILDELNIKHTRDVKTPDQLTPVQSEMDMGNVGGIAQAFLTPEGRAKFDQAVLYVSRDGYVIDGHHRWAGALAAQEMGDKPIDLNVVVVDLDHEDVLKLANEYNDYVGVPRQTLGATSANPKPAPKREVEGEVGIKGNPPKAPEGEPPKETSPPSPEVTKESPADIADKLVKQKSERPELGPFVTELSPKMAAIAEEQNERIRLHLASEGLNFIKPVSPDQLVDEVSGDDALKNIRSVAANNLRKKGRFPLIRSPKDIEEVVGAQYRSLFDQIKEENPELLKTVYGELTDKNLFWDYLSNHIATDLMTKYSDPKDISPLAKKVNQLYAEKFLGVKPGGFISFYRNNIHHKDTEADAAAGYASLDRYMAFDYNVERGKGDKGKNTGRYEIKARPDEITGLLGFSRISDEIGAVISPEVTSIPGRVTRLGDLEIPNPENAPWFNLKDLKVGPNEKFDRSGGGSPFRHLKPLGQFDYYALDSSPFGDGRDWASFYEENGLTKGALPAKYDELYGEGAWERDWGSETPRSDRFYRLFESFKDKNGNQKWRLKGESLHYIGGGAEKYFDNPEAGDEVDRSLKVLSSMQELIGKPFFVSRGHDPNDSRLKNVEKIEPIIESAENKLKPELSEELKKSETPELDFTNFKQISGPLGSNPGGKYQDPNTGNIFYVKIQDKNRGDNEALASALYKEAGIDALEVKKGLMRSKQVTYTDWKTTPLTSVAERINNGVDPNDPAFDGFAIDAWLGNWDVVGTGYDNLSYDKDGNPVRIDSGGSLLYRARGERKGSAFGNEVGELETFKDKKNTTGQLFSNMSPEAERKSVEKLRAITPEKIDELVDKFISDPADNKELKEKLKARREFILNKYPESEEKTPETANDEFDLPIPPRTDEENESIELYQSPSYYRLAKYMADPTNGTITEEQKAKFDKAIPHLKKVTTSEELPEGTKLYRGTFAVFSSDKYAQFNQLQPGDIVSSDNTFTSTTRDKSVAIDFAALGDQRVAPTKRIVFDITTENGATGAVVGASGDMYDLEKEVVLPIGAQLEVIGVEKDSNSNLTIKLKYKNTNTTVKKENSSEKLSNLSIWGRQKLRDIKASLRGEIYDTQAINLINEYGNSDEGLETLQSLLHKYGLYRKVTLNEPYLDAVRQKTSEYSKQEDPNLNIDLKPGTKRAPFGILNGGNLGTVGYVRPGDVLSKVDNADFGLVTGENKTKASEVAKDIKDNGFREPIEILYNPNTEKYSLNNSDDVVKLIAARDNGGRPTPIRIKISESSGRYDENTVLNPIFFTSFARIPAGFGPPDGDPIWQIQPESPDMGGIDQLPTPDRTNEEKEAITGYQKGQYLLIKDFIKGEEFDSDTSESVNKLVSNLKKLTESEEIPEGTKLYRGTIARRDSELRAQLMQLKPGDEVISSDIFTSTSLDPEVAEGFAILDQNNKDSNTNSAVIFEIKTEKGATGSPIEPDGTVYDREKEVILPIAAKFTVSEVFEDADGTLRIRVKYGKKQFLPEWPEEQYKSDGVTDVTFASPQERDDVYKYFKDARLSKPTEDLLDELINREDQKIDSNTIKELSDKINADIEEYDKIYKRPKEPVKKEDFTSNEINASAIPYSIEDELEKYLSDKSIIFTDKKAYDDASDPDDPTFYYDPYSILKRLKDRDEALKVNEGYKEPDQTVFDFAKEWFEKNKEKFLYINRKKLKEKLFAAAESIDERTSNDFMWKKDAIYNAITTYQDYVNKKAVDEMFLEYEKAFPGQSEDAKSVRKMMDAAEDLSNAIKNASVTIAIDEKFIENLFKDGRIKSQFETAKSRGLYDPIKRAISEFSVNGVPIDIDDSLRPIYGYLGLESTPELYRNLNPFSTDYRLESPNLYQYGNVRVVLKSSIKNRTRFTAKDSLSAEFVASDLTKVDRDSVLKSGVLEIPPSTLGDFGSNYLEAQIHGGVSLDDIEKFVIPAYSDNDKEALLEVAKNIEDLMKNYGISIPVEVVQVTRERPSLDELEEQQKPKVAIPSTQEEIISLLKNYSAMDSIKEYIDPDKKFIKKLTEPDSDGDPIPNKSEDITGQVMSTVLTVDYLDRTSYGHSQEAIDFAQDWIKRNKDRFIYFDIKEFNKIYKDKLSPIEFDAIKEQLNNYAMHENTMLLLEMYKEMKNEVSENNLPKIVSGIDLIDSNLSLIADKLDNAEIVVAVDEKTFAKILEDKRIKTQFETQFSNGLFDNSKRTVVERALMGLPIDLDPKNRPIYGYLVYPTDDAPKRLFGTSNRFNDIDSSPTFGYGDVKLILKKSVRDRSTATMNDSFDRAFQAIPLGEKIDPDSLYAAGIIGYLPQVENNLDYGNGAYHPSYTEAQIHGGISSDEIETIILDDRNSSKADMEAEKARIQKELDKAGISIPIMFSSEYKNKNKNPNQENKNRTDITGTRLSDDARQELSSVISNLDDAKHNASDKAYKEIATELGRDLSLPWDTDRTPEGRETYEYIRSAIQFKKDSPDTDEEKELLRIKNLYKDKMDNDQKYTEALIAAHSNPLYRDIMEALTSKTNNFDGSTIAYALLERGLTRQRPRISKEDLDQFAITTPDYADDEVNSQVYDVTVDPEQSVEITNKDLKEFSESGAVSVIMPSRALEKVLEEGRIKTVHETKRSMAGVSNEEYRALRVLYESMAFGYEGDSPLEGRPVYGSLASATLPPPEDALKIYGGSEPAQVVLKPEVKKRTTISDRDSLNNFDETTPLTDPEFKLSYLTQMAAIYREATGKNFFESENFAKFGSIEAQIHGGVTLDDIEKVVFYEMPSVEMIDLLTSKGIIWEFSSKKPYSKPRSFGGGLF